MVVQDVPKKRILDLLTGRKGLLGGCHAGTKLRRTQGLFQAEQQAAEEEQGRLPTCKNTTLLVTR